MATRDLGDSSVPRSRTARQGSDSQEGFPAQTLGQRKRPWKGPSWGPFVEAFVLYNPPVKQSCSDPPIRAWTVDGSGTTPRTNSTTTSTVPARPEREGWGRGSIHQIHSGSVTRIPSSSRSSPQDQGTHHWSPKWGREETLRPSYSSTTTRLPRFSESSNSIITSNPSPPPTRHTPPLPPCRLSRTGPRVHPDVG